MFIVLDNVESILDPQGADGQEIYGAVEELRQFGNICLAINVPHHHYTAGLQAFGCPTLSMDAARNTFYRIYDGDNGRPDLIDNILKQLDFHPLSVTLLATVAHQNKWDGNRLAREWKQRQTAVLQTEHNKSLAARSSSRSPLRCSENLALTPEDFSRSSLLPAGCRREQPRLAVPYHLERQTHL